MQIHHALLYKEFINRENSITHASYHPELEFYDAIKSGNVKKVKALCKESLSEKEGLGELSKNALQNLKYHFVITAAMITRYCIEGGMDFKAAYTLSDYYILTADACASAGDISALHQTMCIDYAKRMNNLKKQHIYSKHVSDCIDYIYDHLHTRITLEGLAEEIGLSASHLSRLFKQEMGMPVSTYVQHKKIETAKSMLSYSDFPVSEIASVLAFSSQSYFSEVFRRHTNMTPLQYRSTTHLQIPLSS